MGCHHKRWSRYCSLISYPNSGPIYHSNGGLYTNNNAIKPSYTSEEVEKTTAKEIKRCLFSHGHHQTVSMNSIDSFKYDNFSGQDTATRTSPDQAIKDQLHASAFIITFTIDNFIKKTDMKQIYRHMSVTYIFIKTTDSPQKITNSHKTIIAYCFHDYSASSQFLQ